MIAMGASEAQLPVGLAVGVTVVGRAVDDRRGERYVQSVAEEVAGLVRVEVGGGGDGADEK